jgi:hypothetical protein
VGELAVLDADVTNAAGGLAAERAGRYAQNLPVLAQVSLAASAIEALAAIDDGIESDSFPHPPVADAGAGLGDLAGRSRSITPTWQAAGRGRPLGPAWPGMGTY